MVATNYSRSFAHASRVAASSLVATDQFAHAGSVFIIQMKSLGSGQGRRIAPVKARKAADFASRVALATFVVRGVGFVRLPVFTFLNASQ